MSYRNSNTARMQPRVQPRLRVPWAPAEPTAVVPRSVPWLAAVAGGLLMLATFGWGFAGTALSHGMADYQEWAGRDAMRKGEPAIVAQHDWQHALRLQPQNPELRLDLARSYLAAMFYYSALYPCSTRVKYSPRWRRFQRPVPEGAPAAN